MKKNLVIVESPAKARTLSKILGRSYNMKASLGHVRDLPKSQLGVDVEKNFIPKYVVPKEKKKVVLLNHKVKTYIETDLPLDMSKIISDDVKSWFKTRRSTGTVKETEETKKIMGKECKAYEVVSKEMHGDVVLRRQVITVWATTDLSFDLKMHELMLENLRKMFNRDEKYRKELKKIKGIQMRLETTQKHNGNTVRHVDEIVEISDKEPPEDAYSVPSKYTKKEKLINTDL